MDAQLYCVTYTVEADFEDIVRSTYVYAANASSADGWIRRYWKNKFHRMVNVLTVTAVVPMVGKIVATTWGRRDQIGESHAV